MALNRSRALQRATSLCRHIHTSKPNGASGLTKSHQESKLMNDARQVFAGALKAADPRMCVRRALQLHGDDLRIGGEGMPSKTLSLAQFQRVVVVGCGKASVPMALEVEQAFKGHDVSGHIITKHKHYPASSEQLSHITVTEAGHPIPDNHGVEGTQKILRILEKADQATLVIALISGGGSALLTCPREGLSLADLQQTSNLLLKSGATITEINTVRKQLDIVKGGGLAKAAFPATVVSLILSDVVGDPISMIASGPTVQCQLLQELAMSVLSERGILPQVPPSVIAVLRNQKQSPQPPALQSHDVTNLVIGSNKLALRMAEQEARRLGYTTLVLSDCIEGEAAELAKVNAALARSVLESNLPIKPPACIILGGESTVKVTGSGKGGRNMHGALASAQHLHKWLGDDALNLGKRVVILNGGTDGTDGPTDSAGAVVDGSTYRLALAAGLNPHSYLVQNDSYHFFDKWGGHLLTGPTGTNVMDVTLVFVDR